jgi:signal-transduction protein with cAMP-binding, CBS, and nucleotidyltransferase domain
MKISELMHTPAVTCGPNDTVAEVARLMADRGVGCVVVVDPAGALTGIVTDRDLALRVVGEGRTAEVAVESVMTRDVATVSPHAPVETAAQIMQKRDVRRLPVTEDDGRLHGLIALDDMLRQAGDAVGALTDTVRAQRDDRPDPR